MPKTLHKFFLKTEKQIQCWKYIGWTLPFVAIALIVVQWAFNLDTLYEYTMIGILLTFLGVSVFWWWWAIDKIYNLVKSFDQTQKHFDDLAIHLKEIKKEIKDLPLE